jgi:ferrochelatase
MGEKRIAVVFLNIGGPDSVKSVRKYLFNFFSDRNIIDLPLVPRKILAFIISTARHKSSGEKYKRIGGKSPLLENTQAQVKELDKILE